MPGHWARQDRQTVILSVHVQPGALRTEVVGEYGDSLKIRLAVAPVDGKANAVLVQFVARELNISRSEVALVSGATSRYKRLQVSGSTLEAVIAAFRPAADRPPRRSPKRSH